MKEKAFFAYNIFMITFTIITILLSLYVSLTYKKYNAVTSSSSTFIYSILIVAVVITIILSIIQLYFARKVKRIPQVDTEELEIHLRPEMLLQMQIKIEVRNVIEEVERLQKNLVGQDILEIPARVLFDIDEILHISSDNVPAALLLLSAKIEQQVRARSQAVGLQLDISHPLPAINLSARKSALFPAEIASTFHTFLAVKNTIAHSAAFDVDKATMLAFISIGIELLKIISIQKGYDTVSPIANTEKEA